jgi:hypothetical protein
MIFLIVQENDVPIPFPQPDRDFIQIIAMRLDDARSSDSPDRDGTPGPGRVGVDRELIARQLLLPEGSPARRMMSFGSCRRIDAKRPVADL